MARERDGGELMVMLPHRRRAFRQGWTPLSLGVRLWSWHDASQETLTGVAVATFTDRSGNGRNFTQATGDKQPIGNTSPHRLTFDGSNDGMTMASASVPVKAAVLVALDPAATASNRMVVEGNIVAPWYCYGTTAFTFRIGISPFPSVDAPSSTWLGTAATVAAWVHDGSTMSVRKDGSVLASGSGVSGTTVSAALSLMSRQGSSLYTAGDVYEVIIIDTPTAADVSVAEDYLSAKWGTP